MNAKVLVVDDEANIRRLLEAMLVPAGYQVIPAENGAEAITKAILSSPDVILLDIMMPGMDGLEVASRLRANKQTKDTPIVMVTALGAVGDRVKALESGADDFLTKPIDRIELLTRVKTLVEKSERIKQLIVPRKRPLIPIVSIAIAVAMAAISTILVITNKPSAGAEATNKTNNIDKTGAQAGLEESPQNVTEKIEYVDVIREVVKEVTVEKPIEQREFASLEELKAWLEEKAVGKTIFFFTGANGTRLSSGNYDCDDYALDLQKRALDDGYLMSVTIIEKGGKLHMIDLVTIGNDVYYIEPQTDEVWFYCNRD